MRGRRTRPRLRIPFEPGTPGEGVDLMHEDGASIRSRRPSPSYGSTANIGRPSDDGTSYNPAGVATLPSCFASSSTPTLLRMIFSSLVIVSSPRFDTRCLRSETTPPPSHHVRFGLSGYT